MTEPYHVSYLLLFTATFIFKIGQFCIGISNLNDLNDNLPPENDLFCGLSLTLDYPNNYCLFCSMIERALLGMRLTGDWVPGGLRHGLDDSRLLPADVAIDDRSSLFARLQGRPPQWRLALEVAPSHRSVTISTTVHSLSDFILYKIEHLPSHLSHWSDNDGLV